MAEYSSLREEESLRQMLDTTGALAGAARAVRQTGCGAMDLCFLARGSVDAVFGGACVCICPCFDRFERGAPLVAQVFSSRPEVADNSVIV